LKDDSEVYLFILAM